MENKVLSIQDELLQLKASAYDVSREVNRYSAILQQINARIEELQKQAREEEASAAKPQLQAVESDPSKKRK